MLVGAGLLWLAALATAATILLTYDNTPGAVTQRAPASWPSQTSLARVEGRPTLVMLLHPKCPCSRASVAELSVLLARAPGALTTHIVFHAPEGASEDWHRTDLWDAAAAIPGAVVGTDQGGAEARRFGIATSGHTLLYDGDGRLQFTGGITASRGHQGDNAGRRTILALLQQRPVQRHYASVFGCSLLEHDAARVSAR
jgi:hypothetical protein